MPYLQQVNQITENIQSSFIKSVDLLRLQATHGLDSTQQAKMGQFLTPAPTACLLAFSNSTT